MNLWGAQLSSARLQLQLAMTSGHPGNLHLPSPLHCSPLPSSAAACTRFVCVIYLISSSGAGHIKKSTSSLCLSPSPLPLLSLPLWYPLCWHVHVQCMTVKIYWPSVTIANALATTRRQRIVAICCTRAPISNAIPPHPTPLHSHSTLILLCIPHWQPVMQPPTILAPPLLRHVAHLKPFDVLPHSQFRFAFLEYLCESFEKAAKISVKSA